MWEIPKGVICGTDASKTSIAIYTLVAVRFADSDSIQKLSRFDLS